LKKNLQRRATQKPEVGAFYKTFRGNVFQVTQILNETEAKIRWTTETAETFWDFSKFPEPMKEKLTELEVELL